MVKMIISVAPAFLALNNKTVNAVIMQLEQENKNEKEDPEKDSNKEKKFFDEEYTFAFQLVHEPLVVKSALKIAPGHSPFQQIYHLSVPTPPPDVRLA
jgi:hypothetical protein